MRRDGSAAVLYQLTAAMPLLPHCFRLLFDGGPNNELWRRNAAALNIPVGDIEAAVLSHW